MSMIRVENITFSYPSSFDPVFENVSFQIDTEWKLGLVGRNGRGKTTLLKLLLGEQERLYSKKSEDNVLRQYRKKAEKQKETAALYPYGTGGSLFKF